MSLESAPSPLSHKTLVKLSPLSLLKNLLWKHAMVIAFTRLQKLIVAHTFLFLFKIWNVFEVKGFGMHDHVSFTLRPITLIVHGPTKFLFSHRSFVPLKHPPSNVTEWDDKLNYLKNEIKTSRKSIHKTVPSQLREELRRESHLCLFWNFEMWRW
jgi:hypothetical protein